MTNPQDSFTFTVGKLDAGMAILIGERAHLIEFPSLLLPPGVGSGSIVNIAVHRNTAEEQRQKSEFWELQEDIYQTYGLKSPQSPQLILRNVTQTSVTLEWPALQLATAKLRSLDIYKNGQRLATIPSPLQNTSTKLSGLEVHTEYSFQLVLRTTAGTYPSNIIRLHTHTITDTSGISVCFGNVQDAVMLENAKIALREMQAKWSDKIQIDTTHFVCTTPAAASSASQSSSNLSSGPGVEYQRALQLSIPIVQPHWISACHAEKKMVPIANYYLGATPSAPLSSATFTRPQSLQNPPGPRSPPLSNRASLPPASSSGSASPTSPPSRSSVFVNQTEAVPEEPDSPETPSSGSKSRPRNGTMKKDFKFPNSPSPPVAPPPPVPSLSTNEQTQPSSEPDQSDVAVAGYEVAPQEVPPPPPVEKETVQVMHEEDVEDEVGPTVEVDLS
ncbi:hypothetical protein JB92DRAFT_3030703 [Gautieria morchelliformis]|nr:hypothetical protein JB92DRAFT_3030703 [Gautieria morchelliformis]